MRLNISKISILKRLSFFTEKVEPFTEKVESFPGKVEFVRLLLSISTGKVEFVLEMLSQANLGISSFS